MEGVSRSGLPARESYMMLSVCPDCLLKSWLSHCLIRILMHIRAECLP